MSNVEDTNIASAAGAPVGEQPPSAEPVQTAPDAPAGKGRRTGWFSRWWHYAVTAAVLVVVAGGFFAIGWFASGHADRDERAWFQEARQHLYPRERGFHRGGQANPRIPARPYVPSDQEAYLGVRVTTVTPELQQEFDLAATSGALVISVDRSGPAFQAGIRRLDVITTIDGAPVTTQKDVVEAITAKNPGDAVSIVVDRDGQTLTFQVTLGSRPSAATG